MSTFLARALGAVRRLPRERSCRWLPVVLGLLLAGCAGAPPRPQPVAAEDWDGLTRQLRELIRHERRAGDLAGISIALVDDQQVRWLHGQGWADVARRIPADGHTRYRVGSVSKLLTDTAALQLVAEGRLGLDDPLSRWLPELRMARPWGGPEPTVRQLMTHHAGLPRDWPGGMWGSPAADFRQLPAQLADQSAVLPAGRMLAYSNVGVSLLGLIVERAAGQRFEPHLARSLLQPLQMDDAAFEAEPLREGPRAVARGHQGSQPREEPGLRDVPAGGLSASVADLAQFLRLQFAHGRAGDGRTILPEDRWAESLRPQNAEVALDGELRVGLGWMLSTFGEDTVRGGGPVAHHGGATWFHRTQLMMLPEQRLGVVVASNDAAAQAAVNRIAQRALALMLQARTGRLQGSAEAGWQPAAEPWSRAARQACTGDWLSEAGPVEIVDDDGRLRARLGVGPQARRFWLAEGEDGRWSPRWRLFGLLPVPLGVLERIGIDCPRLDGRDVLRAHLDQTALVIGHRLPAATPLPPEAAALVGRYRVIGAPGERLPFDTLQLREAEGRLWLSFQQPEAFGGEPVWLPLQPPRSAAMDAAADTWLLPGPWGDAGSRLPLRVARDGAGRVQPLQTFAWGGWTFVRRAD
ncbi:MAG: hypothetical protein RLY78_53 [Pseudomonadota bacterium]